jgi:hypothetical protein
MNKIKEYSDYITKWAPLIAMVLTYWFGVVKTNERFRTEISHLKEKIELLDVKASRLDDVKADKYMIDVIMNTLNRMESKHDKLQENLTQLNINLQRSNQ